MRGMHVIIELNGLPGCGKTTLKNAICIKNLTVKSAGVAEFRGEGKSTVSKIFVKLKRFSTQFTPDNIGLYLTLKKLIRKAKPYKSVHLSNPYENTITIMYMVYLYCTYRKAGDTVLLVDEGIVQSMASCCTQMDIERSYLETVMQYFQHLSKKIVVINCECTLETSLRRIKSRKRNDSAMDQLNFEELQIFLERYKEKLLIIRSLIGKTCRQVIALGVEDDDPSPTKMLAEKVKEYL